MNVVFPDGVLARSCSTTLRKPLVSTCHERGSFIGVLAMTAPLQEEASASKAELSLSVDTSIAIEQGWEARGRGFMSIEAQGIADTHSCHVGMSWMPLT